MTDMEWFWTWWQRGRHYGYEPESGTTRLAFSPEDVGWRRELAKTWEEMGLEVTIDGIGNVVGRLGDPPYVLVGSHTDTVPHAGDFDGVLGVLAGMVVARRWDGTRGGLLLVDWSCEESSRFGVGTVGSRAAVGDLTEDHLSAIDAHGTSLREAATDAFGYGSRPLFKIGQENIRAALELHIEQGKELVQLNVPVAVVSAIAAPQRWRLDLVGEANHSGSTAMADRRDALALAAAVVRYVEELSREWEVRGLRSTVANLEVKPGVANVVPAQARLLIDVRAQSGTVLSNYRDALHAFVDSESRKRRIGCTWTSVSEEQPGELDAQVRERIACVMKDLGFEAAAVPSWPSHDSLPLSRVVPAGMVFVRNMSGVSHHPGELPSAKDIAVGLQVFGHVVKDMAQGGVKT